jgi:hypothetical protein
MARCVPERIEPIVVVIDDPRHGRERIEPPQVRRGDLGEVEFGCASPRDDRSAA